MRKRETLLTLLAALLAALLVCGCDSDDGEGDGGNGDTVTAADTAGGGGLEDCDEVCMARSTGCEVSATISQQMCDGLCAQDLTEEQGECLENAPCDDLEALFFDGPKPCGLPDGPGVLGPRPAGQ